MRQLIIEIKLYVFLRQADSLVFAIPILSPDAICPSRPTQDRDLPCTYVLLKSRRK